MSTESFHKVIGRAMTEPEFRSKLLTEPDSALEGYELTEEETAALKQLSGEKFDAAAGELEERISRAGLGFLGKDTQDVKKHIGGVKYED